MVTKSKCTSRPECPCDFCVRVRAKIAEGSSEKDEQNKIAEDFPLVFADQACGGRLIKMTRDNSFVRLRRELCRRSTSRRATLCFRAELPCSRGDLGRIRGSASHRVRCRQFAAVRDLLLTCPLAVRCAVESPASEPAHPIEFRPQYPGRAKVNRARCLRVYSRSNEFARHGRWPGPQIRPCGE
jgi:hypothetical protein